MQTDPVIKYYQADTYKREKHAKNNFNW